MNRKEERSMSKYEFSSVFAPYIHKFIDAKEAMGFSRKNFDMVLKGFDLFFIKEQVDTLFITQSLIAKWRATQVNCSEKTIYTKYSIIAQFSRYMNHLGFSCFVPRLPKRKYNTYVPYIFTHEQIEVIFTTCDSLLMCSHGNLDSRLFAMPAILRLLYSTGMRVSEATSLLNQDVDIERKLIMLRKTKNQQQRLIPINTSLFQVLNQYIEARDRLPLKNINSKEARFFISPSGLALTQSRVYAWFMMVLKNCGIPHIAGRGPRVHDLRHTCAVHSLMNQVKSGADIYCVLPILSVFLGHKKPSSTETYVRLTQEMYPGIIKLEQSITQFLFPTLPNNSVQHEE
jgi:site-specific recombinase XerD